MLLMVIVLIEYVCCQIIFPSDNPSVWLPVGVRVAEGPIQEQFLYCSLCEGPVWEKLMKDCNQWNEPVLESGKRRKEWQKQSAYALITTPIPWSPEGPGGLERCRRIIRKVWSGKGVKGKGHFSCYCFSRPYSLINWQ